MKQSLGQESCPKMGVYLNRALNMHLNFLEMVSRNKLLKLKGLEDSNSNIVVLVMR